MARRSIHFHPDYIPAGFSICAPARTEAWRAAVADVRTHGMELRLRSPGSALSEIARLDRETGTLEQAMAWLGGEANGQGAGLVPVCPIRPNTP